MNVQHAGKALSLWRAFQVEILEAGLASLDSKWNYMYIRPPFSRLYYTLEGAGCITVNGEALPLQAGQAYLLPAGMSLKCSCPDKMTQLYFHIALRTADGYDLFTRCSQVLTRKRQADDLARDYLAQDLAALIRVQGAVQADMGKFVQAAGLESALRSAPSAFLQQVFSVVRQELRSSLTIGDVANRLAISPSSLTKRFHQEFGLSLGRYMDEMLIQEICRLLSDRELTVGQIADRLGFCDQFYLSRFFRAHQNLSPREYRERQGE